MDFVEWFNSNRDLIGIASTILAALASFFSGLFAFSASHVLKRAKKRKTYVVCPHCKQAIQLEDLDFFLPGGSKDNDLNGVPDDKQ